MIVLGGPARDDEGWAFFGETFLGADLISGVVSGANSVVAPSVVQAAQLAAREINA